MVPKVSLKFQVRPVEKWISNSFFKRFCPLLEFFTIAESLSPRYYKVGVCEYISGGKRAPRRPDPDDDYSGVRNPAPVVASSDDENRRCPGCARKRAAEKE